jgi:dienelactone hydrolase
MKIFNIIKIIILIIVIQSCSSNDDTNTNILDENLNIGHTAIVFYDNIRDRNIETQIYYPSATSGDNTNISPGSYPVIIFGHGFLMDWESYQNYWEELVPDGYIICFPTTEMSLTPSHEDFGEDLKFLAAQMQNQSEDENSIFHNSILPKTAIMGHSMGGGASFLASENNSIINTMVNFASAETMPSAISSAFNVTIPSLIFSGENDCVAPTLENQDIMYNNLASQCKTQIKIIDGNHCNFANSNFNCDLGESFCSSNPSISREQQQQITFDFLKLWLEYTLFDNQSSMNTFNDQLQTSTLINFTQFCN